MSKQIYINKMIDNIPNHQEYPILKTLNYHEMYNLMSVFIKKFISIKGINLTIIKGFSSNILIVKDPYISLQIIDEKPMEVKEINYTNRHKILLSRSKLSIKMVFAGAAHISALQIAQTLLMRLKDSWQSREFSQYASIFFPLYLDDVSIKKEPVNEYGLFKDLCSFIYPFEYHPTFDSVDANIQQMMMGVHC